MSATAKQSICKLFSLSLITFVGFKMYSKKFGYGQSAHHITLGINKYVNLDEFRPKRTLFQMKQLIIQIFKDHPKSKIISRIEYLGSGVHFDAYSIHFNNIDKAYLLRIARYNNNNGKSIKELKFEFNFLPKLEKYLNLNNINIQIPIYDESISNTRNPHKSYIYGIYSLIKGKRLASFDINQRIKILDENKDKLAKLLNTLHSFKLDDDNTFSIKRKSSYHIFNHMIQELEWIYFEEAKCKLNSNENDIKLAQFIENDVIDKCRNVLAPKWKNANDEEFLYGLIHPDFHLNHILCDENNFDIVGIIDWSDVCLSHIPFQFNTIWYQNKKCFDAIIDKYINSHDVLSKDDIGKQRFLCFVEIYGFMSLLFGICWFKVFPGSEHLLPGYIELFQNETANWQKNISNLESLYLK